MKKFLLLLIFTCSTSYSQSAVLSFYYGSNQMLGSEVIVLLGGKEHTYLGGGFSGALNADKGEGTHRSGDISDSELQNQLSVTKEQWCSLYGVSSFGYLGDFLIKFRTGLAVYKEKVNFKEQNRSTLEYEYYNKTGDMIYYPLGGIEATYQITENYGLEIGFDNFNYLTAGFTVFF